MTTPEKKPKSICQIKIPCDQKDQTCNSIIALTAFKTTDGKIFHQLGAGTFGDTSFELEGMGENSTISKYFVVKKCEDKKVDGWSARDKSPN